jgi:branched-chain amino acid transport system ATP-binding protein
MAEPMLKVTRLNKHFGAVHACKDLDLVVDKGSLHALIGPNGAGKTTVIRQLAGELIPDSGVIEFDGKEITRLATHKRARMGLARSFQITTVFEHLSVEENIGLAVQAHLGHSFRFWKPVVKDPLLRRETELALERCGLEDRFSERAGSLSHGEKCQLEVGMALAGKPKLLLLDEPMAGMGPGGTAKMTELILALKGEISILLIEHDMDAVFALADQISVQVYGALLASGDVASIRANPEVQRAYLGDGESDAAG